MGAREAMTQIILGWDEEPTSPRPVARKSPGPTLGLKRVAIIAAGAAVVAGVLLAAYPGDTHSGAQMTHMDAPISLAEKSDSAVLNIGKGSYGVGLKLSKGQCVVTPGPAVPTAATQHADLGLWMNDKKHLLCFAESKAEPQIMVSAAEDLSDANFGDWGFGPGVNVSLRPELRTRAIWRLQANVKSLPIPIDNETSFRALAIVTSQGTESVDVPFVIARMRQEGWPIDVHFMDKSFGQCLPRPGVSNQKRFVCRGKGQVINRHADFIAFCPTCGPAGMKLKVEGDSISTPAEKQAPWLAWKAQVPKINSHLQFTVSVLAPGQDRRLAATERFNIVLVSGRTSLAMEGLYSDYRFITSCGHIISFSAMAALAITVVAGALALIFLPGPVAAQLPSLSATLVSLQVFALLPFQYFDPQMQDLCGPIGWIIPQLNDPWLILSACGIFMGVVMLGHGMAVFLFIAKNGKGSSAEIPHCLSVFGTWELRALPFVAYPVAVATSSLAARHGFGMDLWDRDADIGGNVFLAILFALVPVSMLCVSGYVFWQVSHMFSDELVVRMTTRGDVIYTDRVCDQIRAVPTKPGSSALWSDSLSWACAPTISAMEDMSHGGSQLQGPLSSWQTMWSETPWVHRKMGKRPSLVGMSAIRSGSALNRSSSRLDSAQDNAAVDFETNLSPAIHMQPVAATPTFTYNMSSNSGYAGLAGLPWVHAAIPASALKVLCGRVRTMEAAIGSESTLYIGVAQLAGRNTGGRWGACFEWCDRCPYRWSADLAFKVFLGMYVGTLPFLNFASSEAMRIAPNFFISVVLLLAFVALAYAKTPYVQTLDNISLFAALISIMFTTVNAQVLILGSAFGNTVMSGMVVLNMVPLLIPVAVLFVTSARLALWSLSFPLRSVADTLRNGIVDWDRIGDKYMTSGSTTNVSIVPVWGTSIPEAMSRIELPAIMQTKINYVEISAATAGVRILEPKEGAIPRMPVPVDLLMATASAAEDYNYKSAAPIGAVLIDAKARCLYSDDMQIHNGDETWQNVVSNLFGQQQHQVANAVKEAIKNGQSDAITVVDVRG